MSAFQCTGLNELDSLFDIWACLNIWTVLFSASGYSLFSLIAFASVRLHVAIAAPLVAFVLGGIVGFSFASIISVVLGLVYLAGPKAMVAYHSIVWGAFMASSNLFFSFKSSRHQL